MKKIDKRIFKKSKEEIQEWLKFRKRHSVIENKKAYNRKKNNKIMEEN